MTLWQYAAIGAGAAFGASAMIVGAVALFFRKAERVRQKHVDAFHARRDSLLEPLRAKGNRERFSLNPERTKNDG